MAVKKTRQSGTGGGTILQLNLVGAVIISLALVAAAAMITYGLVKSRSPGAPAGPANLDNLDVERTSTPPWGQLIVRDIDLEQPEEYVAYETVTNRSETWTFENMTPQQVRAAMQSAGVPAGDIDRALSPAMLSIAGANTAIQPDSDLVFSLSQQTRAKLYNVLAHSAENEFIHFPFVFRTNTFDAWFGSDQLKPETSALLRQLMYRRGDADCFSDLYPMLQRIPDETERLRFVKALSRQSAVMVRVRIWPDTDVDKLIGYWERGLQVKDVRPLLDSLKRTPDGNSMSILYFLPQFARQRLYTFPQPSHAGDPAIDCHWSTMNFFNDPPDNRFSDPKYIVAFLATNYYQIAKPTAYGDIVLLMDDRNDAIHSAVYLADDLVFTKNGNNFAQPWMLMRLKDLVAEYTTDVAPHLAVYRNKNW